MLYTRVSDGSVWKHVLDADGREVYVSRVPSGTGWVAMGGGGPGDSEFTEFLPDVEPGQRWHSHNTTTSPNSPGEESPGETVVVDAVFDSGGDGHVAYRSVENANRVNGANWRSPGVRVRRVDQFRARFVPVDEASFLGGLEDDGDGS